MKAALRNETASGGSRTGAGLQNHTAGPRHHPAGPGVLFWSFQPWWGSLGTLLWSQTEQPKVEGRRPQTLQTRRPPVLGCRAWRNLLFHGIHGEATPSIPRHGNTTASGAGHAGSAAPSSDGEGEFPILLTLPRELCWEEAVVIAPAGLALSPPQTLSEQRGDLNDHKK